MPQNFSAAPRRCLLPLALVAFLGQLPAQTPKWQPDPELPPPPLTYHGLIPGRSSAKDVREELGEPEHEALWYAYKMVYSSGNRPGHLDAVHLESKDGKNGRLGNIEAASVPEGWDSWNAVREKLGEPEQYIELWRHSLADYTEKGARFVFDRQGGTIGVAYVPHGRRRVHAGARDFIGLRHLRQGPQPEPAKPADLDGLRAGAAQVDLTPQDPAWLGPGFNASGFEVHDPLRARCAVLDRDGLRVAIVGADLFGMSFSEIQPIQKRLREQGIDHLVVAASHNHAAADTIGIYGYFPAKYVEYIQKQIERGVLEAAGRLEPVARWVAASDELPLDGARVQGLIRNARNPGIVDPQMAVLQAIGQDEAPIVTFVHFACHVEGLAEGVHETSADFPGYLCDKLSADVGGVVVFLNGALGGMVSGDTLERSHEQARIAGHRFAKEAKRILGFAVPPRDMAFSVKRQRVELPLTNPRLLLFMKMSGRRSLVDGRVPTEMYLLRLGEAELVTLPGEMLPELAFEILEEMRGYPRLLIGLANDELGYMIPPYDFRASEYEESMSVGPATGPTIRDNALRLLRESYNPQRYGRSEK